MTDAVLGPLIGIGKRKRKTPLAKSSSRTPSIMASRSCAQAIAAAEHRVSGISCQHHVVGQSPLTVVDVVCLQQSLESVQGRDLRREGQPRRFG